MSAAGHYERIGIEIDRAERRGADQRAGSFDKPVYRTTEQERYPRGASVYWVYSERGHLMYVGITKRGFGRVYQHANKAPWWPLVARIEIEHYHTRSEAEAVEIAYIRCHKPYFNTLHKNETPTIRDLAYS